MARGLREYGFMGAVLGFIGAGAGGALGMSGLAAIGTTTLATVALGTVGLIGGAAIGAIVGGLVTVGMMAADDGVVSLKNKWSDFKKLLKNKFSRKQGVTSKPEQTQTPTAANTNSQLVDKKVSKDFKKANDNTATTNTETKPQQNKKPSPKSGQ